MVRMKFYANPSGKKIKFKAAHQVLTSNYFLTVKTPPEREIRRCYYV
jgi:hypothetical protein